MNEADARRVLLVRAIESADTDFAQLSQADREHAGRAAAELARWQATEQRSAASADQYLVQRARLLLDKLAQRQRGLAQAADALAWRGWIDVALPLAALLAGALFERLGDRGQINVLAFPLLALLLWNLIVYAALLAARLRGLAGGTRPGLLRAALRALALRAGPRATRSLGGAWTRFGADWSEASAALNGARLARVLHLSAAAFALGALAGLYLRGLVFDYRAGWESTFLDAPAVHALLSTVLGPAARLLGDAFPDVAALSALRFPASAGESAARWIHWYALTVLLVAVLPRLLLAAWAAWRAHGLASRFSIDHDAPYFRRLLGRFSGTPRKLRVLPYSFTLDEVQLSSLQSIARQLLGDDAELALAPSVAFGEETRVAAQTTGPAASLTLALFNLAATPERENHGAFVDALTTTAGQRAMLVDTAAYARRVGNATRVEERRAAWRAFAQSLGWPLVFVDLAAPDFTALEQAFERVQENRG